MWKSAVPAALFLLTGCSSFSLFGGPTRGQIEEIRGLIEQLGAEDIERREAAMLGLRDADVASVPELRSALRHDDFEIRVRARQLLAEHYVPEECGAGDWFVLSLSRDRMLNLAGRVVWRPHTSPKGLVRYLRAYRDKMWSPPKEAPMRDWDGFVVHIRVQEGVASETLHEVLGIIATEKGIPFITRVRSDVVYAPTAK